MHDHNLDDLIIDNIEPKNSKTKSFLTIVALLIAVLIVAIILTKILLKTPNGNKLAFEENITEMIAPELKLKETPGSQKEKEEPSLSQTIESKPKTSVAEIKKPVVIEEQTVVIKKEEAKSEIKLPDVPKAVETEKEPVLSNILDQEIQVPAPETKKPVTVEESLSTIEEEAKNAADIAYWEAVQKKRKAEEIAYKSMTVKEPTAMIKEEKTEKVVKEAVQIQEPVKPKKIQTSKPVVTPVKKPVAAKTTPKNEYTKYYVQVGAYRNKPGARFMSVIQNNGYNYIITKPNRNGIKKVLIGPYGDRESVNSALIQVRDRVHKQAFVVKR